MFIDSWKKVLNISKGKHMKINTVNTLIAAQKKDLQFIFQLYCFIGGIKKKKSLKFEI